MAYGPTYGKTKDVKLCGIVTQRTNIIYIYIYIYMCVCVHVYIYICIFIGMWAFVAFSIRVVELRILHFAVLHTVIIILDFNFLLLTVQSVK
jgi:hypothetical protein